MKGLAAVMRVGVAILGLLLLQLLMASDSFDGEPAGGITNGVFAEALLLEWSFTLLVLGGLLAISMIGASYLVRDERLENLIFDIGGEEE